MRSSVSGSRSVASPAWPVPLVNPGLFEKMGVAHLPPIPASDARRALRAGWRPMVGVQIPSRTATGKPGPSPSDRGTPALDEEAAEVDRRGPVLLGLAVLLNLRFFAPREDPAALAGGAGSPAWIYRRA